MGGRLRNLFLAALAALVMRACVMEPIRLTDDSMGPLLADGDLAFVSKTRYGIRVPGAGAMLVQWSNPKKGDVVAVIAGDPPANLVRRIAALPGEKVQLPSGEKVDLKKGEYYLLAEKNEGVMDSRRFGPVPLRSVLGKVSYKWIGKNASKTDGSQVESGNSGWRLLEPIL